MRWALETVKWGADFLVNGITSDRRYLLHICDIEFDHLLFGRAELYPQMDRNIRYCAPGRAEGCVGRERQSARSLLNPRAGQCSDVTGEAAAALAHAALVFRTRNPALSTVYWNAAVRIYAMTNAAFASSARDFGTSSSLYPTLTGFYNSTATASHVFFSAASMLTACRVMRCPDEALYKAHANKCAEGVRGWGTQAQSLPPACQRTPSSATLALTASPPSLSSATRHLEHRPTL